MAAWRGWPSQRPFSRSLIGRIGRNSADEPAMVEVAERPRPPVVDRHEPGEQMGHGSGTSLTSIHNPSTTSTIRG